MLGKARGRNITQQLLLKRLKQTSKQTSLLQLVCSRLLSSWPRSRTQSKPNVSPQSETFGHHHYRLYFPIPPTRAPIPHPAPKANPAMSPQPAPPCPQSLHEQRSCAEKVDPLLHAHLSELLCMAWNLNRNVGSWECGLDSD